MVAVATSCSQATSSAENVSRSLVQTSDVQTHACMHMYVHTHARTCMYAGSIDSMKVASTQWPLQL